MDCWCGQVSGHCGAAFRGIKTWSVGVVEMCLERFGTHVSWLFQKRWQRCPLEVQAVLALPTYMVLEWWGAAWLPWRMLCNWRGLQIRNLQKQNLLLKRTSANVNTFKIIYCHLQPSRERGVWKAKQSLANEEAHCENKAIRLGQIFDRHWQPLISEKARKVFVHEQCSAACVVIVSSIKQFQSISAMLSTTDKMFESSDLTLKNQMELMIGSATGLAAELQLFT